jgi:hypothetical protein
MYGTSASFLSLCLLVFIVISCFRSFFDTIWSHRSLVDARPMTMFVFGSRALFALFTFLTACLGQANQTEYDVIVVGGGPSGLSAASALSRVMRKVILVDSGEYRNNPTRHMHDVIGNDRMYLL